MTSVIEILTDCRLFAAVPAKSFQRLAAMARLAKFRKGQMIFRENEDCPGVYVVGKGMVRVFKTGSGGKEHVLHMVEAGGTFAEVAALGGFKVPASAEAVEATLCVLLPQPLFRKALEEDHPLCLGMLSGLSLWVKHLVGLLEDVVLRDAAGRIANYLLDARRATDGDVALPSLKRYVASHLNLTSETFSRTFRRLIDAGLISLGEKNHVRIVAPERLRSVAQGHMPKL
jgi:CRP/FNR family transcriptional regulator